ncbi:MAG: hypothetical protein J7L82_05080 [Staphylothermus sp.]|nr:hypothetical protein [Staphylothermus sp.]
METLSALRIYSNNKNYVESLKKTLHPDNVITPDFMEIIENISEDNNEYIYEIVIKVKHSAKNFDSLRGALDEILSIIEMIDNVLIMLK